jgi:hypothetical protein
MDDTPEWDPQRLLGLPAFQPLHPAIARMAADGFPDLAAMNALLQGHPEPIVTRSGQAVRFVPQEYGKLPFARQYEPRCYLHGEVPTREDNWHDLLNALVWCAFPRAKAAINERHYLAQSGAHLPSGSQRGTVRDMNTLFDESGVVVPYADAQLADLLRGFGWKGLFWHRRAEVLHGMGFYLFGHGLYEKALKPYIGMTGQGLLLPVEAAFFGWPLEQRLQHLDEALARYLNDPQHCLDTRELTPVPLLGIPGWHAGNAGEAFYDNTDYFRPGRQSRAARMPLSTAPSSVAG